MKNSTRFLGIVNKAGRLVTGEEMVSSAAQLKKARLLITASDAGEYVRRHANYLSETKEIPLVSVEDTKLELGIISGRATVAIAAITDMGMAASYIQKLNVETNEYDELESQLTAKAKRFAERKKKKRDSKSKLGKRRQNI